MNMVNWSSAGLSICICSIYFNLSVKDGNKDCINVSLNEPTLAEGATRKILHWMEHPRGRTIFGESDDSEKHRFSWCDFLIL